MPLVMWALSALFVVFSSMQTTFFDVATPKLAISLSGSEEQLSGIAAAYFYAYGLLQIIVGIVLDRFGAKKPLILAIICSAIGALLFSIASDVRFALSARIIMGIGTAFSYIGCLKLVQEWFPPSKFSTLTGITSTVALLAAGYGLPIAWGIDEFGWREVMMFMGIGQLILVVLVLIIIKDPYSPNIKGEIVDNRSIVSKIIEMLRSKQFLLNIAFSTCICLMYGAFGGLFGAKYIMKYYDVNSSSAADIGSFLFIGAAVGSLFFGWFCDKIKSRKKPMMVAGFGGVASLSVILFVSHLPIPVFELALFLTGFSSGSYVISYAYAGNSYPQSAGLAIGILNMVESLGIAFSEQIVGFILQYHSSNLSQLSIRDFQFAFSSILIFMIVSAVSSLFITESNLKEIKS
jgi:MFS family permease